MKKIKRLWSFVLIVSLVFSGLPCSHILAEQSDSKAIKIIVENKTIRAGEEFTVDISVKNNPGILGAGLKVNYDSNLTLTKAESGEAFSPLVITKPGNMKSPYQVVWDGVEISGDEIKDGTILTLTFRASSEVSPGDKLKFEVTTEQGEIVDSNLNPLDVEIEGGDIHVTNYTPGDVNDDNKINSTDVILMRREIAGGYATKINTKAADVNADGKINSTDVILVRRYIAGGYGVELKPSDGKSEHKHTLVAVDKKEATCTENGNVEYWQCTSCDKYFSDSQGLNSILLSDTVINAKGHTSVIDPAVAATYDSTGLTEGTHCSDCGTVLVKQEVIPQLKKTEYSITYHLYEDDVYLQKQNIENTNPDSYSSEKGLTLNNLKCDGYIFEGWYDGEGANANQVKQIAVGEKGNIDLYAHWSAREYTITFDSPLAKVDSIKYKVNEGATLTNPEWFGYTFMGWTDEDDKLVDSIPKGTIGNKTLHANWTSKRNQARPVKKLEKPIVVEDEKLGQYLFAYEIGQMENVPLYTIKDFGNTSGLTISETITTSGTISEQTSKSMVNTVANATTRTTSWSLSRDWNNSMTIIKSHTDESGQEVVDSSNKVTSDSTVTLNSTNVGAGSNYSRTDKNGVSAKVGAEVGAEYSSKVTGELGIDGAKVGAEKGFKVYGKVSGEMQSSHEDSTTVGLSGTWGASSGTQASSSTSNSESHSRALSSKISDTYGYNKTISEGGSEGLATSDSTTSSTSNEYATAIAYSTQKTETTSKTYSNEDAPEGYYRLVCAGTVHVFAVVAFDIKTGSYYVYTYGVQDDDTFDFIDYSKQTHSFDDYENGVLPFEVPFSVKQYIDDSMAKTKGLVYDSETGTVVDYTGTATDVRIPDYISTDNGDGTTSVVKIVGIEKNTFAGNKDIKSVKLSKHIKEIPAQAFEECKSLRSITDEGVEKIGEKAFSGCTDLEDINITKQVTELGKNAFKNVKHVSVRAKNVSVADAAVASGAKQLVVNLADLEDTLSNKTYNVPSTTDYFEINGGNKTYNGLKIVSDAKETAINGFVFENNKTAPIVSSSSKMNLSRITANSDGFAMTLSADNTSLALYGTIKLKSSGSNAVLSKNISLSRLNSGIVGKMELTGNLMICGSIEGKNLLTFEQGDIVTINEESYENLLNGSLEWIRESEMPEGATVVGQKWTYDYTTKITSSKNAVDGYTLYDSSWVWGNYGGWSGWTDSYIGSSDSRKVETQSVPASYVTQYNYIRYLSADGKTSGPSSGTWGGKRCTNYQERGWGGQLACVGSQNSNSVGFFYLYGSAPCWYYEQTRQVVGSYKTQYRYADRSKIYTYYLKKVEQKESTSKVEASDSISNIQRWVQYVIK